MMLLKNKFRLKESDIALGVLNKKNKPTPTKSERSERGNLEGEGQSRDDTSSLAGENVTYPITEE